MRFAHVLKPRPRSVALAALFGGVFALTVPAGFGYPDPVEEFHENHKCQDPSKCQDFTFVGPCAGGVYCKGDPSMGTFYTCRPGGDEGCTNSEESYGYTNCVGKCQQDGEPSCNFNIYHCKQ